MTNREWLESLTDQQLAEFLTVGLKCIHHFNSGRYLSFVSIENIRRQYTQSTNGIVKWLESPQRYEVYVSEEANKND